MADPNIIDPEAIATLKELNPDDNGAFLKEIIGIYLEDTPRRLQDLKASLASGNLVLFTRMAHTIKGSSANVSAVLGTAARTLYCLIARRHQSASDSDGRLQSSRCRRIIDCGSSRSAIFSFVVNLAGPSLRRRAWSFANHSRAPALGRRCLRSATCIALM